MTFRTALATVALLATAATAAHAGPPWITVEYPANPHDLALRGSFVMIRTYHHSEASPLEITATAEGLVNGRRVSQKVEVVAGSQRGVSGLRWTKPADGTWVLVVRAGENAEHRAAATAVIEVGPRGNVVAVSVPSESREGGRWIVPRAVAAREIDALLATRAAMADADRPVGLASR